MNALVSPAEPTAQPQQGEPLLRSLALCDLVDSTSLVERLGDQRAAALLRRHDRLARDLMLRHQGQEIDKTDGFLVLFERPIHAVAYALAYQRELMRLSQEEGLALKARIGVHVGDVLVWQNDPGDVVHGAKPIEVEGLVKPVTARLASLALPGQILVSGVAASLAQRAHGELGANADRTRWLNHGRYRFKGVPEPLVVYEVGEAGIAPLRLPPYSGKAWREVPWWRRPGSMFIEAGIAAAALLLGLWLLLRPPAAIAFAERDWVVLGDFSNQTGQPVFNDSLRTALRIGLEQSRYVNVLSDLQAQDTLKRMRRDPSSTPIDRATGSEIAQREGARALVLASVAEVSGKVRVTAEVIDPENQATVYSDSAEGVGMDSVLASVDKINRQLRTRLGETLASTSDAQQPLAKVTTGNIDALRAYSLGRKAATENDGAGALQFYQKAIELDPEFALAYLGRAALRISADDRAGAKPDLNRARELRERMPLRESLYLEALAASFETPAAMQSKWAMLGEMYPDHYSAFANLALFTYQYTGQFDLAIRAAQKSISPFAPRAGNSLYLLGGLHLAKDDLAKAQQYLDRAQERNAQGLGTLLVEVKAAGRDFTGAQKQLARVQPSGIQSNDLTLLRTRLAVSVDQGDWKGALAMADSAVTESEPVGAFYSRSFRVTRLGLQSLADPGPSLLREIRAAAEQEIEASKDAGNLEGDVAQFAALYHAYLSARHGEPALARSIAESARAASGIKAFPYVGDMAAIAQAQIALADGDSETALKLLNQRINDSELYLLHVVLRDAYLAAGSLDNAKSQSLWLLQHRGRAYAEYNPMQMLKATNVAESNLAMLSTAEIAQRQGDARAAQQSLEEFLHRWPEAGLPPAMRRRIEQLRTGSQTL